MDVGAPELIIILVIVLLLFGSSKLPKLARSIGAASKEFKDGVQHGADKATPTDSVVSASSTAETHSVSQDA